jgi:hypothetical protein
MADDLEKIAGHLIPFLKASYAETQDRLKRAERVIAARQERPAIAGMHALLSRLRRSAPGADLKAVMEEELVKLLEGLGYQEFGSPGDAYDPLRHEPVAGQTDRGKGRLSTVHRKGLACYDDVMIRAVVEVEVAGGEVPPDVNEAFPLPGDHVVVGATGQSHQSSEGG